MKKSLFTIFIFLFLINTSFSQTYWTEDFGFGTTCNETQIASIYSGTNGNWTISQTGNNGINANEWFISATSSNSGAGTCDISCPSGNNQTLHIGNVSTSPSAFIFCPTGDCGAAYDDTDSTVATSKRIESPTINLSSLNSVQMSFSYIMKGQAGFDYARLWFYDGSIWIADTILPQTSGCAFYGKWTYFVINLPVFANNNPDFKAGFEWKNNGDGIATDPSLSVDNIRIAQSFNSLNDEIDNVPFTYLISSDIINFTFPDNTPFQLELYNLTGSLIESVTNKNSLTIPNNGLYLVKARLNEAEYVIKVSNN